MREVSGISTETLVIVAIISAAGLLARPAESPKLESRFVLRPKQPTFADSHRFSESSSQSHRNKLSLPGSP